MASEAVRRALQEKEAVFMSEEDEVFSIEEGFWLRGEAFFLEHLDDHCLLAFPQMGEMHGVFARELVASTATQPNRWRDLTMANRIRLSPAPDLTIISYRAEVTRADGMAYSALVSSAYVRRPGGWKLAFHQHSPI